MVQGSVALGGDFGKFKLMLGPAGSLSWLLHVR